jgi:histidine phosphotransferase ChpT
VTGLTDTARLAEALCARICHDLSGALGAIGAAIEELQERGAATDEALILACDCTRLLEQRLKLTRAAWGPSQAPLSLSACQALAMGLPRAHRLAVSVQGLAPDSEFPPQMARAFLALLLAAADCLPSGGCITVGGSVADLMITISGPRASWPPGLDSWLQHDAALVAGLDNPRELAVPMALLTALGSGLHLSLVQQPKGLPALRLESGQ